MGMYNLIIILLIAAVTSGGNPTVGNTGKCWSGGASKSFTVSAVHSGSSTFDVTFSGGGRSGIAYAKFHTCPTTAFIIGDDEIGVNAPAVDDKATLFYQGSELAVTVIRVHSGTSTFDVQKDGTSTEVTGIAYAKFAPTPSADFIIIDDMIN